MREKWSSDVEARARAHWTEKRTRGLLGNKQLILPPVEHGPLLRAMGLLKADASMPPESVRKYMQISHMLTLVEPSLRELAEMSPEVGVLDLACGNSYLTLAIATSFRHRLKHPARILGVDRNSRLIGKCTERATRLGLDDILRFETAMIDRLDLDAAWERSFGDGQGPVHMLVALHACDTATDDALALGLEMGVRSIAVVPCCQGELAKAWSLLASNRGPMNPIWKWPHMRREVGASMTDALRALLLRGCGYDAAPIEFVPAAHTPKNTMIRAFRRNEGSPAAFADYLELRAMLGGIRIHLERKLPPAHLSNLAKAEGQTSSPMTTRT